MPCAIFRHIPRGQGRPATTSEIDSPFAKLFLQAARAALVARFLFLQAGRAPRQ